MRIAVVGEELEKGRAAHTLNKALERAGISRPSLSVFGLDEGWSADLLSYKPNVIVAAGRPATTALTGQDEDMEGLRGYPIFSRKFDAWVVPTLHPNYILFGNFNVEPFLIHDLQRAEEIGRDGFKPRWGKYILDPTPEMAFAWAQKHCHDPLIAFDIETDRKTNRMTRISFCTEAFTGISFVTTPEYYPAIKLMLENNQPKCVWNRAFDVPVLRRHGVAVEEVGTHDSMVAWHILHTDLPKGLDVVASVVCPEQPRWAHMSDSQPALYNAVDSDILFRIHVRVMEEFEANPALKWTYWRHVVKLDEHLGAMSKAGMPASRERQKAALKILGDRIADLTGKMAEVIPIEIRPVTPKAGYKRDPKVITPNMIRRFFPVEGAAPVERWARLDDLKLSPKLILAYQRHMGHPVAKERVKGKASKDTTNEAAMLRARLKYPEDQVYRHIMDLRKAKTFRGMAEGLEPGPDDRIHTKFNHNPSTLRIATNDPTLQNLPRPTEEFARLIRSIFKAPDGWKLMARDFAGIESVITGYFAKSRTMTYLSLIDIHTFTTAHWMYEQGVIQASDIPEPTWEKSRILSYLEPLKKRFKKERQGIKPQVHAMNYLAKPKQIQEILLTELDWAVELKDITRFWHFYRNLFPELPRFHHQLVATVEGIEEHNLHGLTTGVHWIQNPFGYIHHFYHCASWENVYGKWQWGFGPSATDLAAFPGQSTAAAIAKEAILRFFETYPDLAQGLRLFVHDELLGEWPDSRREEVQAALRAVMETPIAQMPLPEEWGMGSHLQILSEGKDGQDWGNMEGFVDKE